MTQQYEVRGRSTRVFTDSRDGSTCVQYHNTVVVRFDRHYIELDTGGYFSYTTKTRMNQASNQFGLGYQVYQRDYNWYVDYQGETYEFTSDCLVLGRI